MRIVTWNCQGAFRKKADYILSLKPDIMIVQECELRDKLDFGLSSQKPNDILSFGENKHKGLCVFSYGDFKLQHLEQHNQNNKIIAPISVTGGSLDFTLFAIWANNHNDLDGRYIEQVWKTVNHYDKLLNCDRTILMGDFNSNKIWDRIHRHGNHSSVVAKLAEKNIYSVYHKFLNQEQGKEKQPTFYLQRKKEKPYHIDYCFTSADLYVKMNNIEIGTFENWIAYSDHAPLIVNFY